MPLSSLFRTEYSKMVSVLCHHAGFAFVEEAEDIVSDTFLKAAETWGIQGMPDDPTAWLYRVAQNRARDVLRRRKTLQSKVVPAWKDEQAKSYTLDLSPQNVLDSQLSLMFALCDPSIPIEGQIALTLRLMGGLGISEIAEAFLSKKETINKRLLRARNKLKTLSRPLIRPEKLEVSRLEGVLLTLYLLFNEGYSSAHPDHQIREELCREALRLALLLTQLPDTCEPRTEALVALMCFHASRIPARRSPSGELLLFDEQDRSLWELELIAQGEKFLQRAARGEQLSRYHLEAAIAYWHTQAEHPEKWEQILQLYNLLLQEAWSPVAALNRTYALAQVEGPDAAIAAARRIDLAQHPLYHALLANLYRTVDPALGRDCLQQGKALARNEAERSYFERLLKVS